MEENIHVIGDIRDMNPVEFRRKLFPPRPCAKSYIIENSESISADDFHSNMTSKSFETFCGRGEEECRVAV